MSYIYTSVFASEMNRHLNLLKESGRYICRIQSSLRSLDKYLISCGLSQKTLESETIMSWLKTRNVSAITKAQDLVHIRGFCKYLSSFGFTANCPETPKSHSDYMPYIFSDSEFERIISVADNFEAGKILTRSALIFPILLRVLYCCGLRLGEGRSLRWKDVDLEKGVLTIREAKNSKQRFVPMDVSITELLKDYKTTTRSDGICDDYLFESNINPGKPFRNEAFHKWFIKAIKSAGIHYAKRSNHERGPCPHCLRHRFTFKSFLKSESNNMRFEDMVPALTAYLGHESIRETEAYLRSNHSVYTQSHQRVAAAIGHLFPEVSFDED